MKKTALFFYLLFIFGTPAHTQIVLDTTFGEGGRFIHHFSTGPNFARLQSAVLLPEGKILGIGETSNSSGRAAAIRCTADGVLDTSFGNQGEWICDEPDFFIADRALVQPDGKILLSGYNFMSFIVVRLLPNGVYDPSFGNGGKAYFSVWPGTQLCKLDDMVLQPDGKILVCGFATIADSEGMLARLTTDGALDTTFGDSGIRIIPASLFGGNWIIMPRIALQEDGQILASGFYISFGEPNVGFVVRYNVNGQRDTTYGQNGVSNIPTIGPVSGIFTLPSNQTLLLCGVYETVENIWTTALFRLQPDGKIDSSFADNGRSYFSTENGDNSPRNGFLQPDGKVMVFGNLNAGLGFLGRFNADGSIDQTIGPNGFLISTEYYADGFVQPDGKIVTAGPFTFSGPTEEASILRYTSGNTVLVSEIAFALPLPLVCPNPVDDQTMQFVYDLPRDSRVTIELFDANGKMVGVLLEAERLSGKNEETINVPNDLTNGLYLLHLRTQAGNAMVKVAILRP